MFDHVQFLLISTWSVVVYASIRNVTLYGYIRVNFTVLILYDRGRFEAYPIIIRNYCL